MRWGWGIENEARNQGGGERRQEMTEAGLDGRCEGSEAGWKWVALGRQCH